MFHNFFYKKSSGGAVKSADKSAIKTKGMENQQLAVALHKIIIKKKLKTKVILISKNNTWDIRKNIFACLFSVHNTISLSRHEQ